MVISQRSSLKQKSRTQSENNMRTSTFQFSEIRHLLCEFTQARPKSGAPA